MPGRFCLAGGKILVVGQFQRLIEGGAIVTGIILKDNRCLMGEHGDEVHPAEFGGIHLEFTRCRFNNPLNHIGGLRPPCTAIGINRCRVGINRVNFGVDVGNIILARQ